MRFNTGSCPHGNVEGAIIQFEIVPGRGKCEALEMCGRPTHTLSALASLCKRCWHLQSVGNSEPRHIWRTLLRTWAKSSSSITEIWKKSWALPIITPEARTREDRKTQQTNVNDFTQCGNTTEGWKHSHQHHSRRPGIGWMPFGSQVKTPALTTSERCWHYEVRGLQHQTLGGQVALSAKMPDSHGKQEIQIWNQAVIMTPPNLWN